VKELVTSFLDDHRFKIFTKKIFEMVPRLSFYKTKAEQQKLESWESLGKRLRADLGVDIKNGI